MDLEALDVEVLAQELVADDGQLPVSLNVCHKLRVRAEGHDPEYHQRYEVDHGDPEAEEVENELKPTHRLVQGGFHRARRQIAPKVEEAVPPLGVLPGGLHERRGETLEMELEALHRYTSKRQSKGDQDQHRNSPTEA